MRDMALILAGSLGAIAQGLPYICISMYRALGPGEAESYVSVLLWGRVSPHTGIVLTILSLALGRQRTRAFKIIFGLGYSVLMLLAFLPSGRPANTPRSAADLTILQKDSIITDVHRLSTCPLLCLTRRGE